MSNDVKEKEQQRKNLVDISAIIDDMWKGITKLWWLFAVMISLGASLFYFQARKVYAPMYTASATFTVNADVAVGFSENDYNQTMATQIGETFPYLIRSGVLNTVVAEDLGMESIPGSITTEVMEGTNLFTIMVTSSDNQMAYEILQSVIKNYPKVTEFVLGDTKLNIMDDTGVPMVPANMPAFKSEAAKGAFIGLVICVLILAFYALTRNTVRKEDDLKRILNIKCLGALPRAKFKRRGKVKKPLVMLDNTGVPPMFIEAVRTVRTRLEKEMREKDFHAFLVTSSIPGEGKTTAAANLALSLTKRGYSVLLIDGDLRKPALGKAMGLEKGEYGFYDVLTGGAGIEKAMTGYKGTTLQVIQGGAPVMNTARLLNGERVRGIMEDLKKEADYVIIDTPPSAVVSDAAIIAQYVQSVVYVVRQDYAKIDKILEGIEMINDTGVSISGCVLNDAVVGITGYGYGYGYGYGRYGYGSYGKYGKYGKYGYGAKEEKKPESGRPESGRPESGKPESGGPESGKPESGKPESGRPQTGKPESGRPESGKPESGKPESGKPESGRPQTGKPESGRPESGKPESGKSESGKPESGKPQTGKSKSKRVHPERPHSGESHQGNPGGDGREDK